MRKSIIRIATLALLLASSLLPNISTAQYTQITDFTGTGAFTGGNPQYNQNLIKMGNSLFGMSNGGGTNDMGAIFKIQPDGTGYTKLLDFDGVTNGSRPRGSLITDGVFLYGVTERGGINNMGTVFKIKPDGTDYTKVLDFAGTTNGRYPNGSLITDGVFLYGTTLEGGANDNGIVFKIKPNGTDYSKLLDFAGITNGSSPYGALISDSIFLYGMTQKGGTNDKGTIFKIQPDGAGYTKLLDFAGITNGSSPYGALFFDSTFLYGMTQRGGANDMGTLFKIQRNGTGYTKLLDFAGATNGRYPEGSLISDGNFLYGMANQGGTYGLGIIFKIQPNGTNYTKLLDFTGATSGSYPTGSLVSDGAFLYGMTTLGGNSNIGTIFKIQPNGMGYNRLLEFARSINGRSPRGSLISDGTFLYGMTSSGGPKGLGTLLKIQTDGTGYTKLLDFDGIITGNNPNGSLMYDSTFLYGMTTQGGAHNEGTLFKMEPNGTGYEKLLDFKESSYGSYPTGSLVSDGTFLYGTTQDGGTSDMGTLFKIKTDGTGYGQLLEFEGIANGKYPLGSLIIDGTFLYGVTQSGGIGNMGTLFKIRPNGTGYTRLLLFAGPSNGKSPRSQLISDGTFLYGMTSEGGANDMGTIFKIKNDGTGYTKLLDFAGGNNGSNPYGSLISKGAFLYGMTQSGGANNMGTLFKIRPNGTDYTKLLDFDGITNGSNPSGSLISDGSFLYGMTEKGGSANVGTIFKYQYCTPTVGIDVKTACDSFVWIDGKTYKESNNLAKWTLTNANGCDSVVTLNLVIKHSSFGIDVKEACNSFKWINGITYTSSNNVAKWKLVNGVGCDSVITLNLKIKKATSFMDVRTACESFVWIDGKTYTESNNTAKWTLTNAVGCDSVITLNLKINVDVKVTTNKFTITANNTTASSYQWLDCIKGYAVIPSENARSFTAQANGDYAVEIKENGCVDTSLCVSITSVGIEDLSIKPNISIYPNPINDLITIESRNDYRNKIYIIFNSLGQQVLTGILTGETTFVDITKLGQGFYFMQVGTEITHKFKLMKK